MIKLLPPEGHGNISVNGVEYVLQNGFIEAPDHVVNHLISCGYAIAPEIVPAKKLKKPDSSEK